MSLFIFLMVVQAIVAALLVTVILMQKSEGGGLGVGGSPAGIMSARGATDFLTRSTAILAVLFVALSIALAALAVGQSTGRKIDDSLNRTAVPGDGAPAAPVTGATPAPAPAASPAPTTAPAASPAPVNDPLRDATKL